MKRPDCKEQKQLHFMEALEDCNVKVQEVAMDYFRRESDANPAGLEPILPRLLLIMIDRQISTKQTLGQTALYVKTQLLHHCNPRKVLEAVLRSPIPAKPRAKSELFYIIKASASQITLNDKAMSHVLSYIAAVHDKLTPVLLPETLAACEELSQQSLPTFLACVYEMDLPKRSKVLKVLKGTQLEGKYKTFIGEQVTKPADPKLPTSEMLSLTQRLDSFGVTRLEALNEVKALNRKFSSEDQLLLIKSLGRCMKEETYCTKEATVYALRSVGNWTGLKHQAELFAIGAEGLVCSEEELREQSRGMLNDFIRLRGYEELLQAHLLLIAEALPQNAVPLLRLLSDNMSLINDLPLKFPSVLATLRKVRYSQLLESSIPEVRKAAIFCVVEAEFLLGARFEAFLGSMTPGQVRLVNYYTSRKRQAVKQALVV